MCLLFVFLLRASSVQTHDQLHNGSVSFSVVLLHGCVCLETKLPQFVEMFNKHGLQSFFAVQKVTLLHL